MEDIERRGHRTLTSKQLSMSLGWAPGAEICRAMPLAMTKTHRLVADRAGSTEVCWPHLEEGYRYENSYGRHFPRYARQYRPKDRILARRAGGSVFRVQGRRSGGRARL